MQIPRFVLGPKIIDPAINVGLLVLRVFSGLFMAIGHGLGKIPASDKFIAAIGQMGFPFPAFFAWSAGLAELLGGLLIALGLLTRPAALFLGFTMFVAAFVRHATDPFLIKEKALLYLVICLCIFCTGGGRFSFDHLLGEKYGEEE